MQKSKISDSQTTTVYIILNETSSLIDSLIPVLAKAEISRLKLVIVAEQAGLSLTWSHTSEDRFSRVVTQI